LPFFKPGKMTKKIVPVQKAVIAAAGYGTRFLPATKVQPKEMLPLIDKPIIQYLVEEAVASGIKEIIIVTRAGLHILEDHFDSSFELETQLRNNHKISLLRKVKKIPKMASFIYLRQTKDYPYGNASPLLVAKNLIGKDEPFVYMFGDDLVKSETPCIKQLMEVFYKRNPAAILAVQKTPKEEVYQYGTVKYKKGTRINQIIEISEKFPAEKAPSDLCLFGRFILTQKVIKIAEEHQKTGRLGRGKELWVADILNELAKTDRVIAQPIEGKWLTTGDPLRYMKAMVEYALERKDIGQDFEKYLKSLKL
jgi:UTP--glucose-1-phosphate uridylyltransferase